jgi:hypothetical protein
MRIERWLLCVCVGLVAPLALNREAGATIVGGGGSSTTDCLLVIDAPVNTPATTPRNVFCVDGDACDTDGVVNGVCEIEVRVCANSTDAAVASCTLDGVESVRVDHALDNGDPKFDPEFQALQSKIDNGIQPPTTDADSCTTPTKFHVAIKGPLGNNGNTKCGHNKKKLKIVTVSKVIAGRVYTDTDKMTLTCEPAADIAGGCDPQTLFASTFDRIQTQIFNRSCAVSGCHDSQTKQNNLLLETGASITNLINVDPHNPSALGAGWKRVNQLSPTAGDSSTSYLYHKVTGDLPDISYGVRMPFKRPKLNSSLVDVIQLWIDAGAPQAGICQGGGNAGNGCTTDPECPSGTCVLWIPGTF